MGADLAKREREWEEQGPLRIVIFGRLWRGRTLFCQDDVSATVRHHMKLELHAPEHLDEKFHLVAEPVVRDSMCFQPSS